MQLVHFLEIVEDAHRADKLEELVEGKVDGAQHGGQR